MIAILGGNEKSPACAVHVEGTAPATLTPDSGVFTRALARELQECGLFIPFRGMRDADAGCLVEDLDWLCRQIADRGS